MASISLPRHLLIGGGTVSQLPLLVQQLGLRNPLLVSGPNLARTGVVGKVSSLLDQAQLPHSTFTDTIQDPTTDTIQAVVSRLHEFNHDGLIALGGGSPIDTAKAAGVLARFGGRMRDYKAPRVCDTEALPLIAIPTTAGTGSEVSRVTVITDVETNEKMLCVGSAFLPQAAIVDYEFTLTKPLRLTADTGIDSLVHALEAYVSRKSNPFSDTHAKVAMQLLHSHLRTVCTHPSDRTAREAVMLGATQAGIAFSNASVGLVHGMARPLGAFFHIPHGLSNAMLLPSVTEFSATEAANRYADCARVMGLAPQHCSDGEAVGALVAGLRKLNEDLKVPTLREYGVDRQEFFKLIPLMSRQAIESGSPSNNPRIASVQEIERLYAEVYDQK